MIIGWLVDHRAWSAGVALLLLIPFALGVDPTMANPISERLEVNRLADVTLVFASGLLLICLRSRLAREIWLETGRLRRAAWAGVLASVSATLILALTPVRAPHASHVLVALGCLWAVPAVVTLLQGHGAGFLWLFVIAVSMALTPQGTARPWWSPVYQAEPSVAWMAVSLLAVTLAMLMYVSNLMNHRRY